MMIDQHTTEGSMVQLKVDTNQRSGVRARIAMYRREIENLTGMLEAGVNNTTCQRAMNVTRTAIANDEQAGRLTLEEACKLILETY